MIDIHTHIIPSVDDGAQTQEESLSMLKTAAECGTERIWTGSTYYSRESDFCKIAEKFSMLIPAAGKEYLFLLLCCAEVFISAEHGTEILSDRQLPKRRELPCLPNMLSQGRKGAFPDAVLRLCSDGLFPVIAASERYGAVMITLPF